MEALRKMAAGVVSVSLLAMPMFGKSDPEPVLGTVVYADHAYVGTRPVNVGGTIFGGDRLWTDAVGTMQVRTTAARLVLTRESRATMEHDGVAAKLTSGTATFSTANAKAFTLHVASAEIRAKSDEPTVAQVTVINGREMVVRATRGSLSFGVGEDVRVVPEGMAYHVILNPTTEETARYDAQDPQSQPQDTQSQPQDAHPQPPQDTPQATYSRRRVIKAGRSNFIWYAIGLTAVATAWAIDRAVISPDRPRSLPRLQ